MRKILCLALAATVAAAPAVAGTLEDFEQAATRDRNKAVEGPSSRSDSGRREPHGESFGEALAGEVADGIAGGCLEAFGELLLYGVVGGILYGGMASYARVTQEETPTRDDEGDETPHGETGEVRPRRSGEALIPFARLDAGYQFVASDVSALDIRAEAGYAMAAVQVRRTDYREKAPKDDMATTGVHALYRMSFGNRFEMDIGLGALVLQREGSHSGFSFTLPFLVHPSDHFGIEFRPAWSGLGGSTIQDYDVALLGGWRHVSARAGYRWVRAGFARLDGPEIGVSVRW